MSEMNVNVFALNTAPILQALDPACDEIASTNPARHNFKTVYPASI